MAGRFALRRIVTRSAGRPASAFAARCAGLPKGAIDCL
jgi:hypothetical protein